MNQKHAWAAYKKAGGLGGAQPPSFANTIVFKWDLFDLTARQKQHRTPARAVIPYLKHSNPKP